MKTDLFEKLGYNYLKRMQEEGYLEVVMATNGFLSIIGVPLLNLKHF